MEDEDLIKPIMNQVKEIIGKVGKGNAMMTLAPTYILNEILSNGIKVAIESKDPATIVQQFTWFIKKVKKELK